MRQTSKVGQSPTSLFDHTKGAVKSRCTKRRRRCEQEYTSASGTISSVDNNVPIKTKTTQRTSGNSHSKPIHASITNTISSIESEEESHACLEATLLQTSGSDTSWESTEPATQNNSSISNASPVSTFSTQNCCPCTGLVVEEGSKHWDGRSKERPQRIRDMVQSLQTDESSLWNHCLHYDYLADKKKGDNDGDSHCFSLTMRDYERVHSLAYLQRWQRLHVQHSQQPLAWNDEASQYHSVYATPHTWTAATRATTALCRLVHDVMSTNITTSTTKTTTQSNDKTLSSGTSTSCITTSRRLVRNGLALVRPPGHHAHPSMAEGFCIINHIAVAAQYAIHRAFAAFPTPKEKRRIMIVDWDIHHGDGTQTIFYNNPQVLTLSIHRKTLFPNNLHRQHDSCNLSRSNSHRAIGEKEGVGYNINLAWSASDMTETEYYAAFDKVVLPVAREYQPDLILIAAGFDACEGDALGDCCVKPECFGFLTQSLRRVCPRVVASLEGGYLPSALQACARVMVKALQSPTEASATEFNKRVFNTIGEHTIHPSALEDIQSTRTAHAKYWKCFTTGEDEG